MALVLHKGKPYSPPTIHGYTFDCLAAEGEFPGPDTLWGADVAEKDFHKFLLGVEGSPFFLEDASLEIPPPPVDSPVAPVVPVAPIPGAVPTADAEAAAALQRSAIASGALEPVVPATSPVSPVVPADAPGASGPSIEDARASAFAPFAVLRSKSEIAALAKSTFGLEMNPDDSKMLEMLDAVKAEIAVRFPPPTPEV
jgi:hypothetical protein